MKFSFLCDWEIGVSGKRYQRRGEKPHIQASTASNGGHILKLFDIDCKTIWLIHLEEFRRHLILPLSNTIIKINPAVVKSSGTRVRSPHFFLFRPLRVGADIMLSWYFFFFIFLVFSIVTSAEGNSPSLVLFRRLFKQFSLLFLGICDADKALSLWKLSAH